MLKYRNIMTIKEIYKSHREIIRWGLVGFIFGVATILLANSGPTYALLGVIMSLGSGFTVGSVLLLFPNELSFDDIGGLGVTLSPIIYTAYGLLIGSVLKRIRKSGTIPRESSKSKSF